MATTYRGLVDSLFTELRDGQTLEAWVAIERANGRSWRDIAEDLARLTDHKIQVTHAALHDWFKTDTKAAA